VVGSRARREFEGGFLCSHRAPQMMVGTIRRDHQHVERVEHEGAIAATLRMSVEGRDRAMTRAMALDWHV